MMKTCIHESEVYCKLQEAEQEAELTAKRYSSKDVLNAMKDAIGFEAKLDQPNKETIAAMLEADRIAKDPSVKGYKDLDELFADLKK